MTHRKGDHRPDLEGGIVSTVGRGARLQRAYHWTQRTLLAADPVFRQARPDAQLTGFVYLRDLPVETTYCS